MYDTELLILDSSYLLHRSTHTPALANMENGGLYGFLRSLRKIMNLYNPKYVISVFDSGRSQRRKDIYPDYKVDRDPVTEDEIEENQNYFDFYNDQMNKIRSVCNHLGVHTVQLHHAEGDDIVDYVSIGYFGKSVIVTDDMDMMIMVNANRSVYRPMANVEVSINNFYEYTGLLTSRRYLWFKSILGDKSDNITGLPGIGKSTATTVANLMTDFSDQSLKNVCEGLSCKRYDNLKNEFVLIQRNLSLMDTSYESFTSDDMAEFNNSFSIFNYANEIVITKFLIAYGFDSVLDMMPTWLLPFMRLKSFKEEWNSIR